MSIAHATPHASTRSTMCTPFGLRSFRLTSGQHSSCGFSLVHEESGLLRPHPSGEHSVLPRVIDKIICHLGNLNQTEPVARVPQEMSIAHATPHASARSTICTPFGLRSFRLTSRQHSSCGFSLVHEESCLLRPHPSGEHWVLPRRNAESFPGYPNQTEPVARVQPEMSIAHATPHASARDTLCSRAQPLPGWVLTG